MGRINQAKKNIFFAYISNFIILLLGFIQRTVFIYVLGETLLSVNGLYTDILSMLSMAELGIGTAMNFALYKPVAQGDISKIKSFMKLYKKAYLSIATVIAIIGLSLVPFLKFIIKDPGSLTTNELTLYYLIFLFNTVSTYVISYKYSLANAEQKNYIQTNIQTITKIVIVFVQVVMLILFKNFLVYLLVQAFIELGQKVFVYFYFNKLYPYLLEDDVEELATDEKNMVWTKVKALMCHKIGDVARLQTDSIIISSIIDTNLVGKVGNYNYIITYASNFINIIFHSMISSLGNLVATEDKTKQKEIFEVYRFFGAWLFGFAGVGFWYMLTPFIGYIWLDENWTIGLLVISLIIIDFYFKGERSVLENFKIASGIFEQDKYLPLIQGVVNLIISIGLAMYIGLPGVYIGTVISGLLGNFIKPIVIYKVSFKESSKKYFISSLGYILTIAIIAAILLPIYNWIMSDISIVTFMIMVIVIFVVYNSVFGLIYRNTKEFHYLKKIIGNKLFK